MLHALYAAAAMPFEVHEKSIDELQAAQAAGQVTSQALVQAYLDRIRAYDRAGPALNAVLTLNPHALDDARALDRERAERGPRGPLHGIPVLVKDNFDTADMPISGGKLGLATLQPARDATVVERLRQSGAVILGKTALHELAAGITTVSSLSGATRNPYDLGRVPGGSSGGSAAAVAASFAAAGVGTDTCGSVRIPAANQNLVGVRPTMGLVSRAGVVPLSSSQDIPGPLARSAADAALLLDAMAGVDPADGATRAAAGQAQPGYRARLRPDALRGARIGMLKQLFGTDPEDADVNAAVRAALDAMKALGAEVTEVDLPQLDELLRDTSSIAHEFKFQLADYLQAQPTAPLHSLTEILDSGLVHQQLEAVLRLRDQPQQRDTPEYRQTLERREAARREILATLARLKLDALAYPPLQRRPAPLGEPQRGATCQLSATTGLPAVVLPAGFVPGGTPAGLELLSAPFTEPQLLGYAYAWEQQRHPRQAPFSTPPLERGRAPAPQQAVLTARAGDKARAVVQLRYDAPTATLVYGARIEGPAAADVVALVLQRGRQGQPTAVSAVLLRGGADRAADRLPLTAADREALERGDLFVQLVTRARPLGGGAVAVRFDNAR
ncbi:amidase family protein [Xylophilus sp.]|uniref:amidase family protein n=1 Tax=Xylophilus sp. TaxID=2653893 RepID=UPI002D7F6F0C|nr:amidase family protein [Xylophilus sp.]